MIHLSISENIWVLEPQHKNISEYKWDQIVCCHRYESFIFYFTVKSMFTRASTNLTHQKQQQKKLLFNNIFLLLCLLHLCRTICCTHAVQSYCFVVNAFECHSASYLWMHIFVIQTIFIFWLWHFWCMNGFDPATVCLCSYIFSLGAIVMTTLVYNQSKMIMPYILKNLASNVKR